jgi:hypothetical protein
MPKNPDIHARVATGAKYFAQFPEIDPAELIDNARNIPANDAHRCTDLNAAWTSADTYLRWAEEDRDEKGDRGFSNCIANVKRAVCQRIDSLLRNNHLYPYFDCKYPEKLKALERLDICAPPELVHELIIEPRNALEHQYTKPDETVARRALELGPLMLRATQEEADLGAVVALNWSLSHSRPASGEGPDALVFGKEPMLFIDVFEEPPTAKIVYPSDHEVRFAKFESFSGDEAIELAKHLRRHYKLASKTSTGHGISYYREMKRQGGF